MRTVVLVLFQVGGVVPDLPSETDDTTKNLYGSCEVGVSEV